MKHPDTPPAPLPHATNAERSPPNSPIRLAYSRFLTTPFNTAPASSDRTARPTTPVIPSAARDLLSLLFALCSLLFALCSLLFALCPSPHAHFATAILS